MGFRSFFVQEQPIQIDVPVIDPYDPTTGDGRLAILARYLEDFPSWAYWDMSSFSGCAAACAARIPLLVSQGLMMDRGMPTNNSIGHHNFITGMRKFFGLSRWNAWKFFMWGMGDSPQQKAAQFRAYLASK